LEHGLPAKALSVAVAAIAVTASAAVALASTTKAHHQKRYLVPRVQVRAHKAVTAPDLAAVTPGAYMDTRANGLNPATAQTAGTSSVVGALKIVRGAGLSCVLYGAEADHCLSSELIDQGRDINVHNNCGSGAHEMAIFGAAPAGTTAVEITWSDSTTTPASLDDGIYHYDGTTPSDGAAYPTELTWTGSTGAAETKFPIGPGQFCPGG
jgi:hypothetical protein